MQQPLVHQTYQLKKIEGKGGWTYALIPEILPDKKAPFGWVKVKGRIDDYEFRQYHLMPMSGGHLFLPVKAAVRKKIGKQAGDWVEVVLYLDDAPLQIPEELIACLKDEPSAYEKFLTLKENEQRAFVNWIYSAQKKDTQVQRILTTIRKVLGS